MRFNLPLVFNLVTFIQMVNSPFHPIGRVTISIQPKDSRTNGFKPCDHLARNNTNYKTLLREGFRER